MSKPNLFEASQADTAHSANSDTSLDYLD